MFSFEYFNDHPFKRPIIIVWFPSTVWIISGHTHLSHPLLESIYSATHCLVAFAHADNEIIINFNLQEKLLK